MSETKKTLSKDKPVIPPVYWVSPAPLRCDLTDVYPHVKHQQMVYGFVDGQTRFGPWAIMCLDCHRRYGTGIGQGKGQKYMPVQINNITRWQKVAG